MTSATEKALREKLIEALKPYIDVDPAIESNEWGLAQRYNAGLALDALLDCLDENQDEWKRAAYKAIAPSPELVASAALAVLRGDR